MSEPTITRAAAELAKSLAAELQSSHVEQAHWLMINSKTDQKAIVLVTTTDRATEILQDFLDSQVENGIVESEDW